MTLAVPSFSVLLISTFICGFNVSTSWFFASCWADDAQDAATTSTINWSEWQEPSIPRLKPLLPIKKENPKKQFKYNPVQPGPATGLSVDSSTTTQRLPQDVEIPEKRPWWKSFGKRKGPDPKTFVNPAPVVLDVGPRETAPKSNPMVRVPVPLAVTAKSTLAPGIYLGQISRQDGNTLLRLLHQNQMSLELQLHQIQDSPASPLEPVNKKKPSGLDPRVEVNLSDDASQAVFLLKDGDSQYQSDPLPTRVETRPSLPY